ncbi:MAG: J domain-containing protein, partial [Candidatus Sericytochromatia bacterium]
MPTFYEILGVTREATTEDIRQAFRRAAKAAHPDRDSGTESAMVRLNEAYETLKDPDRREAYDRTLKPAPYRLPQRPTGLDPFEYRLRVFYPLDQAVSASFSAFHAAIEELAYDLYDDHYLARFGVALEAAEEALAEAHRRLFGDEWPGPLASALNLYRQGLRQADDAVEDFQTFTLNFDSDLLVQGRALLLGAERLLDEARHRLGAG